MKKIVLLCNAGMSTSILVTKMRKVAKETGYECEINAYPMSEAETVGATADVILLGPQVRFNLKNVKKACPQIPVEAINTMDYGMIKGDKVLEFAKRLIGD